MSYAAFWIEMLVLSMLFTALTIAVSARVRGIKGWFIMAPNAFLFLALLAPAVVAGLLKYKLELQENWFAYASSLFASCLIASIVIQRLGARRGAGVARAAVRWKIGQIAAATVVCLILFAGTIWNMDLEVRHRADVTRQTAGELLLAASPPQVADSQNAAILYARAAAGLVDDPAFREPNGLRIVDQDVFPNLADPLQVQFLDRHKPDIQLLLEAANLPVCRFPHDYGAPTIDMQLPELNRQRYLAEILQLDAARQLALGHTQAAMVDVDAVFATARGMSQGPYLISGLVAMGIEPLATNSLQCALPHVRVAADLMPLHVETWETPARMMQRAWKSEEAMGLSVFADIGSGVRTVSSIRSFGGPPERPVTMAGRLEDLPFRLFLLDNEQQGYQQLMEHNRDAAGMPNYYAVPQLRSEESSTIGHLGIVTSNVAPAYDRMCQSTGRAEALHRAALLGIAVARYRFDHAQLPDKLDALVPQYLAEIPVDPFDGKAMRYRKTPQDWRVYSVDRAVAMKVVRPTNPGITPAIFRLR